MNIKTTNTVDGLDSVLYTSSVPTSKDVLKAMATRIVHECETLVAVRQEIEAHQAAYNRYVDAIKVREERERRLRRLTALLGLDEFSERLIGGEDQVRDTILEEDAINMDFDQLREEIPLWQLLRELLAFVPDAQVAQIQDFFQVVGLTATPQAIDSAVKQHKDIFSVKKRGRHKFISLKDKAN